MILTKGNRFDEFHRLLLASIFLSINKIRFYQTFSLKVLLEERI